MMEAPPNAVTFWSVVITLFLIANPIGNSPLIMAMLKDYSFARQRTIMMRESLFAFLIALFFQFFGEWFLKLLNIQPYAVSIAGGILLLLVAIKMIFSLKKAVDPTTQNQEPMFVPIATPLITGPACMTMIMIYANQMSSTFQMTAAIVVTWTGVAIVLISAPYMQRFFGQRGMLVLEQLMGLFLAMMGMEMIVKGLSKFAANC